MIIKGILKTIDYNNNSCTVRLPLFETSNNSGEVVLPAIFMNQPGMFNGYNEGDIVFVDFENNNLDTPVIIGKLYLGSEKEASNSQKGGLKVASLTVDSNATLPLDTKLVFNNTSSTEAPVDNRYANYKSLLDVIDALNKTEENISQVDKSISDGVITEIKVEYLSQVEAAGIPTVSDLNWQSTIPPLRNGYDIWQKTTCFNKRGQILGTPEIICLTSTSAVFTYWLKISTPVHTGANQKEPIRITAMSKVGTHIETEDTTASLRWKWQSDTTWNVKEENEKNKYTLTIPTKDCKNEDLLIEAYHNDISYASETITFIAQNGPTLNLTRDTAQIAYDSVGKTKLDITSSVSSTAVLYFNGKQVQSAVDFSWTLNNCSASEGLKSPTIKITDIGEASDEASATCTVVYAGTTCSKTFTVTKVRQGNTPYNLFIENSYVSLGTNSNEELEPGWQNYTEHTISIYRNNGLISIPNDRIKIYNENIELPEEGLTLILKCENVEVDTQYKINANHTISIKLSDFTAKTGSITYTLYDGSTAVATDTFNIVKIIPGAIGAAAKSYWLSMSTAVHTGTSQTSAIEVAAMTKEGSEAEKTDTTAYLWYKFKTDSAWSLATDLNTDDEIKENYKLVINADSIKDSDLEVLATHDSAFRPDENTTALSEKVYKFETITYSPLNTPVVDLSNDTDDLSYDASGTTKIDNNEKVTSTAGLYLNGKEVTSNLAYVWTIPKGVTAVGDKTNTITVSGISDQSVKIRCTITIGNNGIDGKFGGRSYYKDFTVTKKLKGDKGDNATNYKLILSKNIIKAETLANSPEVIISLTETTGNSTTYSSTGTLWIAGSQVTVTEGKHHLTLPTDTSSYPIIVEWKNNTNTILLDSAEISLLKDGNDGEPAVVKNAFCWSSNYEYIPATPNDILDNSNVGAWEENKWYIYDGAPTIVAIPGSKIIFFSKRSGIESTINTAIWSKPEVFAVADEDAYNVINTAKGLFGYGQGVYYTYDPSNLTAAELDGTTAPTKITINGKDYEKGKSIEASQIDIAKWIAKGNGEDKPLKSVENRKKVIKLYINAKYIQTGALKVERDTNDDGQKETLFEAGLDNSTVKIGGFEVAGTSLSATIDTSSTNVDTDVERSFNESALTSTGITDITTGNYISLAPTTIYCHNAGDLAALATDQEKFNQIYKDADLLKGLETHPWLEFSVKNSNSTSQYICIYNSTNTTLDNQGNQSPINDVWDIYIYDNKTKTWEKDTSNQLITNVITQYKAQVYVGTDRIEVTNGDKIVKLQNGTLFANSADISGTITATAGNIGGFEVTHNTLAATDNISANSVQLMPDKILMQTTKSAYWFKNTRTIEEAQKTYSYAYLFKYLETTTDSWKDFLAEYPSDTYTYKAYSKEAPENNLVIVPYVEIYNKTNPGSTIFTFYYSYLNSITPYKKDMTDDEGNVTTKNFEIWIEATSKKQLLVPYGTTAINDGTYEYPIDTFITGIFSVNWTELTNNSTYSNYIYDNYTTYYDSYESSSSFNGVEYSYLKLKITKDIPTTFNIYLGISSNFNITQNFDTVIALEPTDKDTPNFKFTTDDSYSFIDTADFILKASTSGNYVSGNLEDLVRVTYPSIVASEENPKYIYIIYVNRNNTKEVTAIGSGTATITTATAGFCIIPNSITYSDSKLSIGPNFNVTPTGQLTAKNAVFEDNITLIGGGKLGAFELNNSSLANSAAIWDSTGVALKDYKYLSIGTNKQFRLFKSQIDKTYINLNDTSTVTTDVSDMIDVSYMQSYQPIIIQKLTPSIISANSQSTTSTPTLQGASILLTADDNIITQYFRIDTDVKYFKPIISYSGSGSNNFSIMDLSGNSGSISSGTRYSIDFTVTVVDKDGNTTPTLAAAKKDYNFTFNAVFSNMGSMTNLITKLVSIRLPKDALTATTSYSWTIQGSLATFKGLKSIGGSTVKQNLILVETFIDTTTDTSAIQLKSASIYLNGTLHTTGETLTASDRNLKENIKYLDYHTDYSNMFNYLKPTEFNYKNNNLTQFGFIAQDILEALPLLDETKKYSLVVKDNDHYAIDYNSIIALNTLQIKYLTNKLSQLETAYNELLKKVEGK